MSKKINYILFVIIFIVIAYSTVFFINGDLYFVLSDDSMISQYFAKHFFSGNILSCQGYSNPLWTLIMIPCNLLPKNLAGIPILLINLACILGIMKYSRYPLLIGLAFPFIFWGIRGSEFIPIAFLFFCGIKTNKIIIPIILITLLRIDGFIFAFILIIYNHLQTKTNLSKILLTYLTSIITVFGFSFLIYRDLPNTYYLKLGYPIQGRIIHSFQWQNIIYFLVSKEYFIPVTLIFLYNMFVGGDAWEQYEFLNRFLIVALPLIIEGNPIILSFKKWGFRK